MKKKIILIAAIITGLIHLNTEAQFAFKLPAYQKYTLSNGLTIYLMEKHEVPIIGVSAILPAGAIYDDSNSGLASFTADALNYGTKSFSREQIEEQLDFLGASINTYATKESATLSATFAKKDLDKVMPIFKEILIDPVFNETEFKKEKESKLQSLERAKESPRAVIGSYWDKFIFGDHPYSNPVNGKISTVSKLEISNIKAFYENNYVPAGSAIAIVGDFDSKMLKPKLEKLFGSWKTPFHKSVSVENPSISFNKAKVLLVHKEDARETTFLIGGKGVSRNNPDYVAIAVVNTVFGGRFTSWLNDELRVNSGLTYGANSRFSFLKNAGSFYISTFTATKTTEPAIDKALEVLNKIHQQGIDEETLNSAKNYVKGQFPPDYETSGQLASLLAQMFWFGFDESFINNFEKNVDNLTVAKAKEVIAKYFPKENLQFILVGKSSDIRTIAKKYGEVIEKDIKADDF